MADYNWYGKAVTSRLEKAVMDGAEEWMRVDVQTDAEEHCPVDQGTLRSTHTVERAEREVCIGVGGPAAPYAIRQHEDASMSHTVGEDHWLENALNRQKGGLGAKVKKHTSGL
jgi:hypothetical protein